MNPPRSVLTCRPMIRTRPSSRIPSGFDSSHFSRTDSFVFHLQRQPLVLREPAVRFNAEDSHV